MAKTKCPHCGEGLELRVMVAAARLFNPPRTISGEKNTNQDALKKPLPDGWQLWEKKKMSGSFGDVDVFFKDNIRIFCPPNEEPYLVNSDLKRLICAYKTELNVAPWDRAWDSSQSGFSRQSKFAAALLKDFDVKQAIKCLQDCAAYFKYINVDWSLKTVAERAMDWKIGRIKELFDQQLRSGK